MDSDTEEIIEERMGRLRLLSQRLDHSITIPGTKYKIGVDPIIGLIPLIYWACLKGDEGDNRFGSNPLKY